VAERAAHPITSVEEAMSLDDDDITSGDGGADGAAGPGPEGPADSGDGGADGAAGTGDGGADGGAAPGPEGPADSSEGPADS
jgi:hypothetical protein